MKFKATLQLAGKTATGIEVPGKIVDGLGQGKRPPVRVTINGYTYPSTVAPMGGTFMLPVSAEVRDRAGVAAGDKLDVRLELDTEPRTVKVPPDLAKALKKSKQAKSFFDGLSYSHQRRYVMWIEEAKKAETRERRVDKATEMLLDGRQT